MSTTLEPVTQVTAIFASTPYSMYVFITSHVDCRNIVQGGTKKLNNQPNRIIPAVKLWFFPVKFECKSSDRIL